MTQFSSTTAEIVPFATQYAIADSELANLTLTNERNEILRHTILTLEARVAGIAEEEQSQVVTNTFVALNETPRNLWQAWLYEDVAHSRWLHKIWKPKRPTTVQVSRSQTVTYPVRQRFCPHLKAEPQKTHMRWMTLEGDNDGKN